MDNFKVIELYVGVADRKEIEDGVRQNYVGEGKETPLAREFNIGCRCARLLQHFEREKNRRIASVQYSEKFKINIVPIIMYHFRSVKMTPSGGGSDRCRIWAFTTPSMEKQTIVTGDYVIMIGPFETSSGLRLAHGIIGPAKCKKNPAALRKRAATQKLLQSGIELHEGYIQPLKTTREKYINYMWKTCIEEMDENHAAWANIKKSFAFSTESCKKLQESLESKPSEAEWEAILLNEFGYKGFTTRDMQLSYKHWPETKHVKLGRLIRTARRNQRPRMTGVQAYKLIKQIIGSAEWELAGTEISARDAEIVLLNAALEAREGKVAISPHILLEGQAGSGKTLLCQLLFPPEIASIIPNDSEGVGQLELAEKQRVVKVDDATDAFWNSSRLLGTIYTMYHNQWTAKVHGSKRDQPAAIAVITSNNLSNLSRFSVVADGEGAERRFLVGRFDQKMPKTEYREIITKTCEDALMKLFEREYDGANQTNQWIRTMEERLHNLYMEMLQTDEREENDHTGVTEIMNNANIDSDTERERRLEEMDRQAFGERNEPLRVWDTTPPPTPQSGLTVSSGLSQDAQRFCEPTSNDSICNQILDDRLFLQCNNGVQIGEKIRQQHERNVREGVACPTFLPGSNMADILRESMEDAGLTDEELINIACTFD
jgi:hypothetical protein